MELFGLTLNHTVADLRKRYYDIALLCHPDHGGSADDMHVVQTSYEQAKALLTRQHESHHKVDTVMQALEEGARTEEHGTKPLPSFRDIFDEVHDGFHHKFNDVPQTGYVSYECDPHHVQGYGEYMVMQPAVPPPPTDAQLAYDPSTAYVTEPPLPTLHAPHGVQTPTLHAPQGLQNPTLHAPHAVQTAVNTALPPSPPQSTSCALALPTTTTPSVGFPVHVDPLQHVKDFSVHGSTTLPRTDYRLAMQQADGKARPTKTWLEAHLPSLRHYDTHTDVVNDGTADATLTGTPAKQRNTLRVRFANGDDARREWLVQFAPHPRIARAPPDVNISNVQRHVTSHWVKWGRTRSSDELLPALVEVLRGWGKVKVD